MDNEGLVAKWQERIIFECERRLHRKLTKGEERFIRLRGGFMALEFIEDTVAVANEDELVAYLNSEKNESY
ncbi:MAG: hypothetical protein HZB95_02810 [Nitrosomonadales bacterium]|nr:hypothetical protein [Nitrosomonadales bacterium]